MTRPTTSHNHTVWRSAWRRHSILLFVLVSCLSDESNGLSSPQPSPRRTTPAEALSFEQFQFEANGVCIQPTYFLEELDNDNSAEGEAKLTRTFTMRNVPGTGDCMFQAVVLASLTSMGLGGNDVLLRAISRETRAVVAQILQSPDGNLNIDGNRIVPARDLLVSAARQEGLSPQDYLSKLQLEGREGGLYGGGPELTVLSNVLRRPISIYELKPGQSSLVLLSEEDNTSSCQVQCQGVFGDRFADPCETIPDSAVLSGLQPGAYSWHLHILVLDVASTGEKHACVLLPQDTPSTSSTTANGREVAP
ncbi:OTU-like cysteine protease [Seminavis robusta]|uniref:OTU-like cysteine protease n=1 Tax=Seminavis robusta TaxID=568900 RepID=A0A9N8HFX2_9STRA|nr:OTU-like cysteine protease [Seminavis robusta]|eukprot:Sro598_g173090.1 OTU-like cysteine protease (307) ;mRNA; f:51359-52279